MCKNMFVETKYLELDEFMDKIDYQEGESKEGSLIAVLHKAQELFGYLPKEVQLYVARKMDLTAAKVFGVITFYSFFSEIPRGRHVINVCMGTACYVKGATGVMQEVEQQLGIKAGQTTRNGKFSIDALRCIGACSQAPVVMIDGKVHGKITRKGVAKLLREMEEDTL